MATMIGQDGPLLWLTVVLLLLTLGLTGALLAATRRADVVRGDGSRPVPQGRPAPEPGVGT